MGGIMKIVVLDGLSLNPGDLDWHIYKTQPINNLDD